MFYLDLVAIDSAVLVTLRLLAPSHAVLGPPDAHDGNRLHPLLHGFLGSIVQDSYYFGAADRLLVHRLDDQDIGDERTGVELVPEVLLQRRLRDRLTSLWVDDQLANIVLAEAVADQRLDSLSHLRRRLERAPPRRGAVALLVIARGFFCQGCGFRWLKTSAIPGAILGARYSLLVE